MFKEREKDVIRVLFEFLKSNFFLFKEFLIFFQKSILIIYLVYDSICLIFFKVM